MNKTEFLQALTLWFVIVIFLQLDSGADGDWAMIPAYLVAIGLLYLIPAYFVLVIGGRLLVD